MVYGKECEFKIVSKYLTEEEKKHRTLEDDACVDHALDNYYGTCEQSSNNTC